MFWPISKLCKRKFKVGSKGEFECEDFIFIFCDFGDID